MSKKTKYALLIILMFIFGFFVLKYNVGNVASADANKHLVGYAWSSNIGWISFSGTGYGVTYDSDPTSLTYGQLSGYAWSSNIGWISFGCGQIDGITGKTLCSDSVTTGVPNYPSGNGVTRTGPKIIDGKLIGFVRACSVFAPFDTGTKDQNGNELYQDVCSGSLRGGTSPDTSFALGGWDGWISLSGQTSEATPNDYGIIYTDSTREFDGYAWGGGHEVAIGDTTNRNISPQFPGWISWHSASGEPVPYGVKMEDVAPVALGVTCSHNPYPIVNTSIVWSADVVPAGNYTYEWNLGTKSSPKDYILQSGSLTSNTFTLLYNTPGNWTTDVVVKNLDGSVLGNCQLGYSTYIVTDKGYNLIHDVDTAARFITRSIRSLTVPDVVVSISPFGGFGDQTISLRLLRIKNENGDTVGDFSSATSHALIIDPQVFWNDSNSIAAQTITINRLTDGTYETATLRLLLTKNQAVDPGITLPSSDAIHRYYIVIDTDGGHEHQIPLTISNPTGGIREQ